MTRGSRNVDRENFRLRLKSPTEELLSTFNKLKNLIVQLDAESVIPYYTKKEEEYVRYTATDVRTFIRKSLLHHHPFVCIRAGKGKLLVWRAVNREEEPVRTSQDLTAKLEADLRSSLDNIRKKWPVRDKG